MDLLATSLIFDVELQILISYDSIPSLIAVVWSCWDYSQLGCKMNSSGNCSGSFRKKTTLP